MYFVWQLKAFNSGFILVTEASRRQYDSVTDVRMEPLPGGFMSQASWKSCPLA